MINKCLKLGLHRHHPHHTCLASALVEVVIRLVDVDLSVAEDAVHLRLKLQLLVDGVSHVSVGERCKPIATGIRLQSFLTLDRRVWKLEH